MSLPRSAFLRHYSLTTPPRSPCVFLLFPTASKIDPMAPIFSEQQRSPRSTADAPVAPEPIAVCGTSLRLPGDIDSPEDLWAAIMAKRQVRDHAGLRGSDPGS